MFPTVFISGSYDFTLYCVVPENSHTPMWKELEIPEVCVCVCVCVYGRGGGGGIGGWSQCPRKFQRVGGVNS